MDEVKKIYILINNLKGGGSERQVSYLSYFEFVDKVILIDEASDYKVHNEKVTVLFNSNKLKNKLFKLFYFIFIPFKLRKLGLNKNITLVTFLQMSHIVGFFCKLMYSCKWVMTARTNPSAFYEKTTEFKIPRSIFDVLLKKSDAVFSNSVLTSNEILNVTKKNKTFTIYNGYDINYILHQKEQKLNKEFLESIEDFRVLITTGRLHKDKAHWHLIRLMPYLKNKINTKLIILGKGDLLSDLKMCCKASNLKYYAFDEANEYSRDTDVYFLGFDSNPYKYYQIADIFVFPSIFEGLPNTPIEAMICGLPCILADCKSGPREILLPESNVLQQATIPEYSKFGVLMPVFNGDMIIDNMQLTENEQLWLHEIEKLLLDNHNRKLMSENAFSYTKKFDLVMIKEAWKKAFTAIHAL